MTGYLRRLKILKTEVSLDDALPKPTEPTIVSFGSDSGSHFRAQATSTISASDYLVQEKRRYRYISGRILFHRVPPRPEQNQPRSKRDLS
jgi:hypothetical protein